MAQLWSQPPVSLPCPLRVGEMNWHEAGEVLGAEPAGRWGVVTIVTMEDVSPPSPPPPAQIGEVAMATEQAASSYCCLLSPPPRHRPPSRRIKPNGTHTALCSRPDLAPSSDFRGRP